MHKLECLNEGGSNSTLVDSTPSSCTAAPRRLNEGGSNSTLVGNPPFGKRSSLASLNEGGSNSTLVGRRTRTRLCTIRSASMKEGRIRPSLDHRCARTQAPFDASMKEGRIRPSLAGEELVHPAGREASMKEGRIRPSLTPTGGGGIQVIGLNEGGSNSTLVATSRR